MYYYFANTASWSNVYLYIWNNDGSWSTDFTLKKIDNTNIYYHKWTSAYNNNGGILFRASTANWDNKTGDIKKDYTSHTSWVHSNTTGSTDLSNINRQAKVVAMLSTGGDYTATANANCTVTVSGYTVENGKSTATSKSASTSGSANNASISAAYGSTITYTATAGTGYTFEGFATKNLTTLPATTYASGKTATASGYDKKNHTTYYAYFKANQYTVKFDANEGAGTMSDQSYTYDIEQALTANAFTRTGYTFEGWNTQADGTGTSYTDKQSVSNLSSTDGETITLYAQWAEIPANIHNISYNNGTGWTYGAQPTSAEEGLIVTFEVIPTTGYTVTVTSDDVTLNKNENEYTFTMPTKDVAITVSATENTHNVTVSYKCGDETIKATATVDAVGEATPTSVTAPEIDGYVFTSWTIGSGIQSANTTANPISITTQASGDYTLVANYTKLVTVYLVNNAGWSKIYAYGWDGTKGETPAWPGAEITANKLAEQYEGYDVYSYKVEEGSYGKVIFNNNSGKQTETFAWEAGKYYYAVDPLGSNVFLAGEMNSWSTTANEFKKATAEATTASVTVNLTAKTYEFKLIIDGEWKGNDGTMKRGGDAVHEGGWSFDGGNNCNIVADIAGDYTFTWNLTDKKLTVAYPPLPKHQVTATVNPAETGEVTGTGEYEQGSEATLVATPAAGYAFKNWTVGGTEKSTEATYTFTVNEPISLVANFIPEVTHEVTVSYLCNSNPIPGHAATTLAVGVTTPSTITAPAITNYTFNGWTLGSGVQAVDDNANPIQITTLASGDYTLTANYTKIELTYTVTVPAGTEKCYIAGDMNSWSFQEMTPTANANEFTITIDGATTAHKYKYTCGAGWAYVEKKADGSDLDADRTYNANDVVAKWAEPAKCYLMGIGGDWTTGIEMEEDGDQFKLLCQPIAEGEQFKFKYGDTWTTEVENYDANGVAWVESYPGSGQYNITLPAGNYDFYYKKNENKVWIGVCTPATPTPDYTRATTAGKFGTICLPFGSTNYTGAELFECVGQETGKVYIASVTTLEAGVPYIFLATGTELAVYSGGTTAATPGDHNGLHGTFTDDTEVAVGNYILLNNELCQAATTCWVNANRAYLVMGEVPAGAPQQMPGRRYIGMSTKGENAETGLENIIVPEGQAVKVISNGQLIIIRDGEMYNAQGQKL